MNKQFPQHKKKNYLFAFLKSNMNFEFNINHPDLNNKIATYPR